MNLTFSKTVLKIGKQQNTHVHMQMHHIQRGKEGEEQRERAGKGEAGTKCSVSGVEN